MMQSKPWVIIYLPSAYLLKGCGNLGTTALLCDTNGIALFNTQMDAELALNTYLFFSDGENHKLREYYEVMEYEN